MARQLRIEESLRTFLITGATDGIGLFTAKLLAQTAPAVEDPTAKRIIAIHGRSEDKLADAYGEIQCYGDLNNYEIRKFCYDFEDMEQVDKFVNDVLKKFPGDDNDDDHTNRQLDCVINNAGIFDESAPNYSKCKRYELTFMVNVVAPFIITKRIMEEMPVKP